MNKDVADMLERMKPIFEQADMALASTPRAKVGLPFNKADYELMRNTLEDVAAGRLIASHQDRE